MGLCLAAAMLETHAEDSASGAVHAVPANELLYIGTWQSPNGPPSPPQTDGSARQGVYVARLDVATGRLSSLGLALELQRAGYLLIHPKLPVIYSVADSAAGTQADSQIHSLRLDPSGKLSVINTVDAGGTAATSLALDVASQTLFDSNYGSGNVAVFGLRSDGSIGPMASEQKDYGSGPSPRQHGPVAHDVVVDPTHRYALVADLGADRIFIYRFDPVTRTLSPAQTPFESLPPGSGPRHLVFDPNGQFLFVVTELTAELRSYRWSPNDGRLHFVQAVDTYPTGTSAPRSAAEIKVSRNGRFLYVSLRGDQNSIVVYAIDQKRGTLRQLQRVSARGTSPWSFEFDPSGHWLVVADQGSDSVVTFNVDPATGELSASGEALSIPNPAAVVFYPH